MTCLYPASGLALLRVLLALVGLGGGDVGRGEHHEDEGLDEADEDVEEHHGQVQRDRHVDRAEDGDGHQQELGDDGVFAEDVAKRRTASERMRASSPITWTTRLMGASQSGSPTKCIRYLRPWARKPQIWTY